MKSNILQEIIEGFYPSQMQQQRIVNKPTNYTQIRINKLKGEVANLRKQKESITLRMNAKKDIIRTLMQKIKA